MVLLEDWLREAVFDPTGTDFLHWHHVIDVIVTVGGDHNWRGRFPRMTQVPTGRTGRPTIPATGSIFAFNAERDNRFPANSPNSVVRFEPNGFLRQPSDLSSAVSASGVASDVALPIGGPPGGFGRSVIRPNAPSSLPWTDADIRYRLELPRRQLLVWTYTGTQGKAEFLLVSPLAGANTDSRVGPICTILALPQIHGNVSGVFRLRFETWEGPIIASGSQEEHLKTVSLEDARNPDKGRALLKQMPPIVSNRWTMSQHPDPETYLNTTLIDGTAVFRMDVLQVLRITPDQLRRYFMHPITTGYVRMPPKVTVSPAGDGVTYQIEDHEVMTNFPMGYNLGLLRIDIEQTTQFHSPFDGQRR